MYTPVAQGASTDQPAATVSQTGDPRRWLIPLVAVIAGAVALGALAWGYTTSQALSETSAQLTVAQGDLSAAEADALRAETQLETTQGTLAATEAKLDDANAGLAETEASLDTALADLDVALGQASTCFDSAEISYALWNATLTRLGATIGRDVPAPEGLSALGSDVYQRVVAGEEFSDSWVATVAACKASQAGVATP